MAVIRPPAVARSVELSAASIKALVETMSNFCAQILAEDKESDKRASQTMLREMAEKNQQFFALLAEQNVTIARDLATANRTIAEKLVTATQEIASQLLQQNHEIASRIEITAADRDAHQRVRGWWLVALNSGICLAILIAVVFNGVNIYYTQQVLERAVVTLPAPIQH